MPSAYTSTTPRHGARQRQWPPWSWAADRSTPRRGGTGGSPFAPGSAGNLANRGPGLSPRSRGRSARRGPRRVIAAATLHGRALGHPVRSRWAKPGAGQAPYHEPDGEGAAARDRIRQTPVILDVDTGIDDMVALLIAATAPELNLRGVTCVAGNVELHDVARNTGKMLRLVGTRRRAGLDWRGRPHGRRLRTAYETHGPTGTGLVELRGEDRTLGKTEFTPVPASRYIGGPHPATSRRDDVRRAGPLPTSAGGDQRGRRPRRRPARAASGWAARWRSAATPPRTGEWNACVDPEAAELCLSRGAIGRIFPLDATQDVIFTMDDLRALPDTHLAGIVRDACATTSASTGRRMASTAATSDPVTLIAASC